MKNEFDIKKIFIEFYLKIKQGNVAVIEKCINDNIDVLKTNHVKIISIASILGKTNNIQVLDAVFNSDLKNNLEERKNVIECLYTACSNGNMNTIKYVMKKINNTPYRISQKELNTCFIKSCEQKDFKVIKFFLEKNEFNQCANINARSGEGLLVLLRKNNLEFIKKLLLDKEISQHADIFVGSSRIIKSVIEQQDAKTLIWMIHEFNITKNKDLIIFFRDNPKYQSLEALFDSNELYKDLNTSLDNCAINKKKNKI